MAAFHSLACQGSRASPTITPRRGRARSFLNCYLTVRLTRMYLISLILSFLSPVSIGHSQSISTPWTQGPSQRRYTNIEYNILPYTGSQSAYIYTGFFFTVPPNFQCQNEKQATAKKSYVFEKFSFSFWCWQWAGSVKKNSLYYCNTPPG